MKEFFRIIKNDAMIIVSGLPRSGTSMMMQMLEAGGIPVQTDNIRKPDKDNPRGYYEHEEVKNIKDDLSWLKDCNGKAVKIVSALLYHLPKDRRYKVIFMRRKMKEILASQKVMLKRLGKEPGDISDDKMMQSFENHLEKVMGWLMMQSTIKVINIRYNQVLEQPYENAKRVAHFLKKRMDIEKMTSVVEKSLYRQRKT